MKFDQGVTYRDNGIVTIEMNTKELLNNPDLTKIYGIQITASESMAVNAPIEIGLNMVSIRQPAVVIELRLGSGTTLPVTRITTGSALYREV